MSSLLATLPTPPRLGRPPRADAIDTMSVTLSWDAWGTYPEDEGDGPVIAYNVYDLESLSVVASLAMSSTQTVYTAIISSLTPDTLYRFYIKVEGPNGEGPPSSFVEVTTLPLTTQPQPTTKPTTTQSPSTSTTNPPTTKPSTPPNVQTTMKTTTSAVMVPDTNTPVVDMTTSAGEMSTSFDGDGIPGGITTKAMTQGMYPLL